MKHPKFTHAFEVVVDLPAALEPLKRLASNFRWTWDHETRQLFRFMNTDFWHETGHNPILFLNGIGRQRLDELAGDTEFLDKLQRASKGLDDYLAADTWFDQHYPGRRENTTIAYFCAEFGVSESLPIYSGGLGVLAGDHLKAASDLGLPLVAVGLLYNRGYFRQRLTPEGWQQEIYPEYDFYQMPLTLIRDAEQRPLKIEVEFPDRVVNCHIWRAEVGRIPLYLLDSNVLDNAPTDKDITDTLYGGDEDMRIRQEMILGIGGMRALRAAGIQPTVCHMNEGHAAFLSVERIGQFMRDNATDARTATKAIVAGNVFTTHTPVPAGFDLFQPPMLERYIGRTLQQTGTPFEEFLKQGRTDPANQGEAFNMAILAMNNANHVNGVSQLHASVSRSMFASRWPGYPEDEVPIQGITNGIHTLTWIGVPFSELFDRHLGQDWRRQPHLEASWRRAADIPDDELWAVREQQRASFVRYVRNRLKLDIEMRTLNRSHDGGLQSILDPNTLTIGFARRFATYKRGSLMIQDRERLKRLLFHPERPIQIVIAGKAHPRDEAGKKVIQDLVQFIGHEGAGDRIVFLEDYDMRVARMMVQGVDLWLNNPRRPHEASGTSGMKVVPNGGLNCSVLDGWWDEGFNPDVGWAIGDRTNYPDEGHQDWLDSTSLYSLLEGHIAPLFYQRGEDGVPHGWLRMVKESIKTLAPFFSTSRMVRDYTERSYMPAADAYTKLTADGMAGARATSAWIEQTRQAWPQVKVRSVRDDAGVSNELGTKIAITANVALGALTPDDVAVQAVVGKITQNRELAQTEVVDLAFQNQQGDESVFVGTIQASIAGYQGYAVRVIPHHADVAVPQEIPVVTWE